MTTPLPVQRIDSGPHASIAIVRLEQADRPVVVLDHDLLRRLEAALQSIPRDTAALVLASASERVFVAGADLRSISEWDDQQLARYIEYGASVFARLHAFPFPTVAAINGAALGGGLELAMHCDGLVASPPPPGKDGAPGKPYPVGLPECSLALCPGWGGSNLLPARIDPAEAIALTAAGTTIPFERAVELRLFDRVATSRDALIDAACDWALERRAKGRLERDGAPSRWIGRPDRAASVLRALDAARADLPATEAAAAVADCLDTGLAAGWHAALECERRHLLRLRHTQPARDALAAFFARSGR